MRVLVALAALAPTLLPASAETVVRYGISLADIPLTSGQPDRGAGAYQFTGYTIYDPLVAWEMNVADRPGKLVPGLATSWRVDEGDPRKWRFTLRQGVSFHDGTAFGADSVIWNLDRFYKNDSPQFDAPAAALARGRVSIMSGYRKVDDRTVEIETSRPISYLPYLLTWILFTSPQSYAAAGND